MLHDPVNLNSAPSTSVGTDGPVACDHCGGTFLVDTRITTAFWQDGGLLVLRDVPAMVCPNCRTEYIADATAIRIDALRGNGFAGLAVADLMSVPVYAFPKTAPLAEHEG